jgi:hypothetical protein
MALDFDSPPPSRRTPHKKQTFDPKIMAVDGQVPMGHELPRSTEWMDYSNEEAGLRSSDADDGNKTDPAW